MLRSEPPEALTAVSGNPLPPLVLPMVPGLPTSALLPEVEVRRLSNLQEASVSLLEDSNVVNLKITRYVIGHNRKLGKMVGYKVYLKLFVSFHKT